MTKDEINKIIVQYKNELVPLFRKNGFKGSVKKLQKKVGRYNHTAAISEKFGDLQFSIYGPNGWEVDPFNCAPYSTIQQANKNFIKYFNSVKKYLSKSKKKKVVKKVKKS